MSTASSASRPLSSPAPTTLQEAFGSQSSLQAQYQPRPPPTANMQAPPRPFTNPAAVETSTPENAADTPLPLDAAGLSDHNDDDYEQPSEEEEDEPSQINKKSAKRRRNPHSGGSARKRGRPHRPGTPDPEIPGRARLAYQQVNGARAAAPKRAAKDGFKRCSDSHCRRTLPKTQFRDPARPKKPDRRCIRCAIRKEAEALVDRRRSIYFSTGATQSVEELRKFMEKEIDDWRQRLADQIPPVMIDDRDYAEMLHWADVQAGKTLETRVPAQASPSVPKTQATQRESNLNLGQSLLNRSTAPNIAPANTSTIADSTAAVPEFRIFEDSFRKDGYSSDDESETDEEEEADNNPTTSPIAARKQPATNPDAVSVSSRSSPELLANSQRGPAAAATQEQTSQPRPGTITPPPQRNASAAPPSREQTAAAPTVTPVEEPSRALPNRSASASASVQPQSARTSQTETPPTTPDESKSKPNEAAPGNSYMDAVRAGLARARTREGEKDSIVSQIIALGSTLQTAQAELENGDMAKVEDLMRRFEGMIPPKLIDDIEAFVRAVKALKGHAT